MKYVEVRHEERPLTPYHFMCEHSAKVGDLVCVDTKYGYKLGKVHRVFNTKEELQVHYNGEVKRTVVQIIDTYKTDERRKKMKQFTHMESLLKNAVVNKWKLFLPFLFMVDHTHKALLDEYMKLKRELEQ